MPDTSIYANPYCVLDMRRAAEARLSGLTCAEAMEQADALLAGRMARRETTENNLGIEIADRRESGIREAILPSIPGQMELLEKMLTGSQAKTAFALRKNAERMMNEGGLNATGFLTLTVGEYHGDKFWQIKDSKEASRRLNNLNRRLLPDLFERSIIVTERHKSGAIHFHILGTLRNRPDIRTGLNWEQIGKRNYRSAPEPLREIWAMLREKLPDYGFGRAELLPVKTCNEAVACYISKYIEKNICNRTADDRRKKLVRYLGWNGGQLKPNGFSWATARACAWREKTRQVAALVNVHSREEAAEAFGPRWAFQLSRTWITLFGDAKSDFLDEDGKYKKPVFDWPFPVREFLRAELVNLSGNWARQKEREKFKFSEEMAEIRALSNN